MGSPGVFSCTRLGRGCYIYLSIYLRFCAERKRGGEIYPLDIWNRKNTSVKLRSCVAHVHVVGRGPGALSERRDSLFVARKLDYLGHATPTIRQSFLPKL